MQHVFDECFKFKRGDLVIIDGDIYGPDNLKIGIVISDFTPENRKKSHATYSKVFLDGRIRIYAKFTLKHI